MFDFDFGLGEDNDMLREAVAAFAADKISPRAADIDSRSPAASSRQGACTNWSAGATG